MSKDKIDTPAEVKNSSDKKENRLVDLGIMFAWLLIWPIVVGSLLLLVMIVVTLLTYQGVTETTEPMSGIQQRLGAMLTVAVAVVICWGLLALVKRHRKNFVRKGEPVLRVYMWSGVLLGGLLMSIIADPQTSTADAGIDVQQSSIVPPNLSSDEKITGILLQVGAKDIEKIDTRFVSSYSDDEIIIDNQAGTYRAYVDQMGNWAYGELTVLKTNDQVELRRTIAHEYLHHVWFKILDEETKRRLTSDLVSLYGRDAIMQDRVLSYSNNQALQPTELFSYYCTESTDQYLSKYVLNQCSKYIDRSVLTYYR